EATSSLEQLLRIKHSLWLTRLWTLQEGAVARRLYFHFRKGATQLESLLDDSKSSEGCELTQKEEGHVPPTFIDLKILGYLNNDIKDFESRLGGTVDSASKCVKDQLRSILRLGYLSLPRFRFFATAKEKELFPIVLPHVRETYQDPRKERPMTLRV